MTSDPSSRRPPAGRGRRASSAIVRPAGAATSCGRTESRARTAPASPRPGPPRRAPRLRWAPRRAAVGARPSCGARGGGRLPPAGVWPGPGGQRRRTPCRPPPPRCRPTRAERRAATRSSWPRGVGPRSRPAARRAGTPPPGTRSSLCGGRATRRCAGTGPSRGRGRAPPSARARVTPQDRPGSDGRRRRNRWGRPSARQWRTPSTRPLPDARRDAKGMPEDHPLHVARSTS